VLVVAPHPDDETLGCGGTLLRHIAEGAKVHWVLVTEMTKEQGFSKGQVCLRNDEIRHVAEYFGFSSTHRLGFPPARLDTVPLVEIVEALGRVTQETGATTLYIPAPGDVHSDHRITFDACLPLMKPFRYPSLQRILAYETLSETEHSPPHPSTSFSPTVWIDIEKYISAKIEAMKHYVGELGKHPFPRSEEGLRAIATFRGSTAGFQAAEAFMLLRERQPQPTSSGTRSPGTSLKGTP
jgi:LmbE family N-acetylglucosaminyl deacetylase